MRKFETGVRLNVRIVVRAEKLFVVQLEAWAMVAATSRWEVY